MDPSLRGALGSLGGDGSLSPRRSERSRPGPRRRRDRGDRQELLRRGHEHPCNQGGVRAMPGGAQGTAEQAVYCSCRCGPPDGETPDGSEYCACPSGFECSLNQPRWDARCPAVRERERLSRLVLRRHRGALKSGAAALRAATFDDLSSSPGRSRTDKSLRTRDFKSPAFTVSPRGRSVRFSWSFPSSPATPPSGARFYFCGFARGFEGELDRHLAGELGDGFEERL